MFQNLIQAVNWTKMLLSRQITSRMSYEHWPKPSLAKDTATFDIGILIPEYTAFYLIYCSFLKIERKQALYVLNYLNMLFDE